jgi:hypothetical protein
MSFQGHIENGAVVLDEPVSLPNGTVVRIELVDAAKEQAKVRGPVVADTDQAYTVQQMAQVWKAVTKPIPENGSLLSIDPDDYPLF